MEDIRVNFGIRLKKLRKERGISQEKLAELANIDRTYVTDIEGGKRNISIVIIERIAKALGLSISFLFKEL